MKIALTHFRVGETDGVSLEMEKWKLTLEKMGHEVILLAGSEGATNAYTIDELHYRHPVNEKIVENAYDKLKDYENEILLKQEILDFAQKIEEKVIQFIKDENIDVIIPNNIWSLGWGLPAGIAFANVAKKTEVRFLAHHHDFHWERDRYSKPTCEFVSEFLEQYFPPDLENVTHVVINDIAKNELRKRRGITAQVVPNVFEFNNEWNMDEFNSDLRKTIGVNDNDILILQATRITERKAIELAIKVVGEIQQQLQEQLQSKEDKQFTLYNGKLFTGTNKIVLVLAGLPEAGPNYIKLLKEEALNLNVDLRFINDKVDHSRKMIGSDKVYSLWDAYVHADLITYPSILEGWGNQLLEGIFAKKQIIIYEYPVYCTDIKNNQFSFISLGNTHSVNEKGLVVIEKEKIKSAAIEAISILTNEKMYRDITNKNFDIGNKKYSYEALFQYLSNLSSLN